MEWTEVESGEIQDAEPIGRCPVGPQGHKWLLSISEGSIGLVLAPGEECPTAYPSEPGRGTVCEEGVLSEGIEGLEMADIPVRLEFESECGEIGATHVTGAGATHITGACDHGYWWNVIAEGQEQ